MNFHDDGYLVSCCESTDDLAAMDAAPDWNAVCHFRVGAGHSEEVTIGTDGGRGQVSYYFLLQNLTDYPSKTQGSV
jgi:hypothetical protein